MRDLKNNMDAQESIAPLLRTASVNGSGIDLGDFDGAMAVFHSEAAITDGDHTPKLQESDDNSAWSDVAAADQEGALVDFSSSNEGIQRVGYKGAKRYVRAVITAANTTTGGIIGCTIIRGIPHAAPVS